MKTVVRLALAGLLLGSAPAAYAGTSEDFAGCDGIRKPKRSDDGMRGEAQTTRWGGSGGPSSVVAACNRAFDSGKLRPEQTLPGKNRPSLARLADELLLRPESERKLIDYKKLRPNILGELIGGALSFGATLFDGIERTSGFRSEPAGDGRVKVEYTGKTTSGPVVQEMTLLRAAELTREAGHAQFVITERKDYQRYLATMQYGFEQSRVLTGYKTELTVRYLDEGADEPAAIDAVGIIDALGPVYYSER